MKAMEHYTALVLAPLGVHVSGADVDRLLLVAADHAQLQGHRQQLGLGVPVAGRRHLHTHVSNVCQCCDDVVQYSEKQTPLAHLTCSLSAVSH